MSYKTVLVHASADQEAEARMKAARSVAEAFGAALVGVGSAGWDPMVQLDADLAEAWVAAALLDQAKLELQQAEANFRKIAAGHPHEVIWKAREFDAPDQAMAALALCGDLVVAGREAAHAGRQRARAGRLVMQAGLPVLLVGAGQASVTLDRVVIGWKNTRETRRAVSDALPILKQAKEVLLAAICEAEAHGAAECELRDVAARLARHGIVAETMTKAPVYSSTADDLRRLCESRAADLLVVGAYGHSRLREWVFGGVTADLLGRAAVTVLFGR